MTLLRLKLKIYKKKLLKTIRHTGAVTVSEREHARLGYTQDTKSALGRIYMRF